MVRVIALIDGSTYSRSVCDHAAWIAQRLEAGVDLLHVLGRRGTSSAPVDLSGNLDANGREGLLAELASLDEQRAKLALKRGRMILDDARARIIEDGVADVGGMLRHGDIIEAVQEFEAGAELIVIGKRGEAADFARMHLGSNLERVVRASHKPVFVASRAFAPITRFLIAFDGGTSAMKAVDHVAASPLFAGLACRLLMVGAGNDEQHRKLEDAATVLRGGGLTVDAAIVPGQPDAVIAHEVETGAIGLVVMGAYGHSRIRSLIIGSTTSEMIRSCLVPVMLFR